MLNQFPPAVTFDWTWHQQHEILKVLKNSSNSNMQNFYSFSISFYFFFLFHDWNQVNFFHTNISLAMHACHVSRAKKNIHKRFSLNISAALASKVNNVDRKEKSEWTCERERAGNAFTWEIYLIFKNRFKSHQLRCHHTATIYAKSLVMKLMPRLIIC